MRKNGTIFSIIGTICYALIAYYLTYPALNFTNWSFWFFLYGIIIVFVVLNAGLNIRVDFENLLRKKAFQRIKVYGLLLFIPITFCLILVLNFFVSPIFASSSYYHRITVEDGVFDEEIQEVNFSKLPLLDKDSTLKIGDRTMGKMSEWVSQFDVSDMYTQINYRDEIARVTPLEYSGLVKWFMNRRNGIQGYVIVNSTTGEANLVSLDKGMKYAPSAYFHENLYRKLQMSYPTKNIGDVNFEIDNEGNPYWIASVVEYVGVSLKREVVGVIILDPITGKTNYYKSLDVPSWVDHVYDADLILEEVADWGKYKKGYWNSFFGQKGVVATTTGYNYLAQDDDVYLYTGITSVINDESNIGFILTNLRTKKTKYYSVAGAEEYSAMDSAEGQVQQMNYQSTFPLLINLNGRPTYLVSLKDNAGLVKMYAFVDVVDYQKVVVTDSAKGIQAAADAYLNEVGGIKTSSLYQKEIVVSSLTQAMIDGNTYYYFMDEENQRYKVSIKVDKDTLPFLVNGDKITVFYAKEKDIITVSEIHF